VASIERPLHWTGEAAAAVGFATERAGFVTRGTARRFVVVHIPDKPTETAVVICSSLYAERHRDYWREVALARALTQAGIAAVRFHYRGTGNSGSAAESGPSFDELVEDARDMAALATSDVGAARIGLLGIGFGALVAACAASPDGDTPLALWKPVPDGRGFFRDFSRARLIAATRHGDVGEMPRVAGNELFEAHDSVDVMGFTVSRATYRSAVARSFSDVVTTGQRAALIAVFNGARSLTDAERSAEGLREAGARVDMFSVDVPEDRWFVPAAEEAEFGSRPEEDRLIERTVDWFVEHGGSPVPATSRVVRSGQSVRTAERALYFRAGEETLLSVVTAPARTPARLGVVIVHNGANNFSAGRNGVWARLSRALADEEMLSLRLDLAGTGDSTGRFALTVSGQPAVDVSAAVDALRLEGYDRVAIVTGCYGALPSLAAAARRDDVAGLVLFSPPLIRPSAPRAGSVVRNAAALLSRSTLHALRTDGEYRQWVMQRARSSVGQRIRELVPPQQRRSVPAAPAVLVADELRRLSARSVPIDVVYGAEDDSLDALGGVGAARSALDALDVNKSIRLHVVPGSLHGLTSTTMQDDVITLATRLLPSMVVAPS
jgi:alpha-beta hydrolase superfamily lysophospholipase